MISSSAQQGNSGEKGAGGQARAAKLLKKMSSSHLCSILLLGHLGRKKDDGTLVSGQLWGGWECKLIQICLVSLCEDKMWTQTPRGTGRCTYEPNESSLSRPHPASPPTLLGSGTAAVHTFILLNRHFHRAHHVLVTLLNTYFSPPSCPPRLGLLLFPVFRWGNHGTRSLPMAS
jgi:hypothetical protein